MCLILQTIDVLMLLESPYPKDEIVVVVNQTAQIVDDVGRPVPLTEVGPFRLLLQAALPDTVAEKVQVYCFRFIETVSLLTGDNPHCCASWGIVSHSCCHTYRQLLSTVPSGILLQVYLHHTVSNYFFLLGNGAEARGSFSRAPLPDPYALIVNGTYLTNWMQRITNIQLINTGKATTCRPACWELPDLPPTPLFQGPRLHLSVADHVSYK